TVSVQSPPRQHPLLFVDGRSLPVLLYPHASRACVVWIVNSSFCSSSRTITLARCIGAGPEQRGTSASSAIRQRAELRLGGVGGMARQTRHAAYPRRALSSDDTGEDRALASDAQEPHPAGELLFARPARGSDRSLRRPLQSPALPREHRQSDASRRLLRTRSNHPAGKRKDQTQNHPTPTLASQNSRSLKSNRMRQNFP